MVGSEKVRATNMNCEVVAVVKHDKSEPVVDVTYCKYKPDHSQICNSETLRGSVKSAYAVCLQKG